MDRTAWKLTNATPPSGRVGPQLPGVHYHGLIRNAEQHPLLIKHPEVAFVFQPTVVYLFIIGMHLIIHEAVALRGLWGGAGSPQQWTQISSGPEQRDTGHYGNGDWGTNIHWVQSNNQITQIRNH